MRTFFRWSTAIFVITTIIGLWTGTTSTGMGALNGFALLGMLISGSVLVWRRWQVRKNTNDKPKAKA
jgi:hypothetical protein